MDSNNTPSPGFSIFGFEIKRKIDKQNQVDDTLPKKELVSVVPKNDDIGDTTTVTAGGFFGQYYDIHGTTDSVSERQLILRYREAAEQPEVDAAINDIVDESIASLEHGPSLKINLDELDYDDATKGVIDREFNNVLRLYNFAENGADIFRKWYIDGRLYYNIVVDRNDVKAGIQEVRPMDPIRVRKIKEIRENIDPLTGIKVSETVDEYYMYTDDIHSSYTTHSSVTTNTSGVRIAKDAIIEVNSGLMDSQRRKRLSHLHKALKVVNQLRIMEDALVIYRLARAPERRIFYIDTGNLPKGKAEEYMYKMMAQYRNKVVYDASTGELTDDRKHMNMLEDFWIPRREGSTGTEISTLPGGENLGQIEDIVYFKKQLYKSLNIPLTRIDPDSAFPGGVGRATEISRDEVKFQKFINRLRRKFSYLILDTLRVQLNLKGIMNDDDWNDIVQKISLDYVQDNHFYDVKELETIKGRVDVLDAIKDFVGKDGYFSKDWVRKTILKQTEQDIKDHEAESAEEALEKKTDDNAINSTVEELPTDEPITSDDSLKNDQYSDDEIVDVNPYDNKENYIGDK